MYAQSIIIITPVCYTQPFGVLAGVGGYTGYMIRGGSYPAIALHVPASRGAHCFMRTKIKNIFKKNRVMEKRPIDMQLEEYIKWRNNTYPIAATYEERWIKIFLENENIDDVCRVRLKHIKDFLEYIRAELHTRHTEDSGMRAIGNFFGYFHARGYPCPGRGVWRRWSDVV